MSGRNNIETARMFALKHISNDVERGISEHEIQLSRHGHTCNEYQADVGLCQKWKPGGKDWPPTKVIVSEIDNEECLYVFSLHELYEELKSGQMALL